MGEGKGVLHNRLVVITGATRGIGRSIALVFAKESAKLVVIGRDKAKLEEVASLCLKAGAEDVECLQADALAHDFASKVAERVADRLDVLINSAGMTSKEDQCDKIFEADVDTWDTMMTLNLLVPMKLTHALAPTLARSPAGGHIINISSIAGLRASKYNAAYSASKWGLTGWSKACFEELKEHNIRVTTIFPAYVSSDMTREVPIDNSKMIQPEDVAQAALLPFQMSANACPSEIVIGNTEPLKKPQR